MKPASPSTDKAADKAYKVIYTKILDGTLSSGTKLVMRKMAAMAGVSVIPVIEALNRLVEDGLVEFRSRWGYFVAMPTRHQIHNQLALREAVECQVARLLNENATPVQRRKILSVARRLDKIRADFARSGKGGEREIERVHYEFHLMLPEMTGFSSLSETLRRIKLFFILLKADATSLQRHLPRDWHEQLADCIVNGTPSKAEEAMRQHVRHSYETILNSVPEAIPSIK